jgi:hypothetical protein
MELCYQLSYAKLLKQCSYAHNFQKDADVLFDDPDYPLEKANSELVLLWPRRVFRGHAGWAEGRREPWHKDPKDLFELGPQDFVFLPTKTSAQQFDRKGPGPNCPCIRLFRPDLDNWLLFMTVPVLFPGLIFFRTRLSLVFEEMWHRE